MKNIDFLLKKTIFRKQNHDINKKNPFYVRGILLIRKHLTCIIGNDQLIFCPAKVQTRIYNGPNFKITCIPCITKFKCIQILDTTNMIWEKNLGARRNCRSNRYTQEWCATDDNNNNNNNNVFFVFEMKKSCQTTPIWISGGVQVVFLSIYAYD